MWGIFFASICIAAAAGALAGVSTFRMIRSPGTVPWWDAALWWVLLITNAAQAMVTWRRRRQVPPVTGRPYTEARIVLEEAGLRMRFGRDVVDDAAERDEVVAQTPAAGRLAFEGSDVSVSLTRPRRRGTGFELPGGSD